MKIAIVHDELLRKGGAERVVISLHKLFPDADIFTSAYNPDTTFEYFKECNIVTSFLQKVVKGDKMFMALFFPFGILAFRSFNFEGYDLIIISSAHGAQYIKKPKNALVIHYAHFLFRLIWEPESYNFYNKRLIKLFLWTPIRLLQKIDKYLTIRADHVVFNSQRTRDAYLKVFNPDKHQVIHPPIEIDSYSGDSEIGNYFLIVSRLEPYKKVSLVVEAFRQLDESLIVVGSGSQFAEINSQLPDNVSLEGNVSNDRLIQLYANCRAFIFPQLEDFGITPLEANAFGKPVIAYGKGGVLETMIPKGHSNPTALFFNEQSVMAIRAALTDFEPTEYSAQDCIKNAMRFSESNFHDKILQVINDNT